MKYFKVYKPAFSDEDAEPVAEGNMLIVCDGLGATGQNKHEIDGMIHTSAYFGSRCVRNIAQEFFSLTGDRVWNEEPEIFFQEFKDYLGVNLNAYIHNNNLQKIIKGKSAELLPTTFAMAVFKEDADFIDIFSIWAGDSRVYLLSADDGLQQISQDDVEGAFDAMKSLGTSNMCNNISGEGEDKFYLNYKQYKIKKRPNLFLFVASDGCFDYLATPMDFEYLLELAIERLPETDDVSLVETTISDFYCGSNLQDDTTMAGVIFDETKSDKLKQQYKERLIDVKNAYRQPTEDSRQGIKAYENDMNAELLAANKALRELSRQVMPYACDLLDGKMQGKNSYLKNKIFNLPCMAGYRETMQERNAKIKSLKSLHDEKQQNLDYIKVEIKDSFQKEYIPFYIKNENIKWTCNLSPLNELVLKYRKSERERETTKANFAKQLSKIFKRIEEIFKDLQWNIDSEHTGNFQKWVLELTSVVSAVKKVGEDKDVFVKEQDSEQELYQLITREFLVSGELNHAFEDARKTDFDGYADTKKLYRDYKQIKNARDQYHEQINKMKDNGGHARFISSLGNVFVNEFISIPYVDKYIPGELCRKIEQYKQICQKQDILKETIDAAHEYINRLWRETYKDTYELYNTVPGGRV